MANEKRLIDANALMEQINNLCSDGSENWIGTDNISYIAHADVADIISDAPTVDAVPVVHGQWEYNPPTITINASWQCSACRKVYWEHILETRYFNYCPNCGAKMDGERTTTE